jgi:transcriptional regulator
MYIPPRFAENNSESLFAFIHEHSFATFVTDDLEVTHLPLLLNAEQTALQGHFAKANPHWKAIDGQRRAKAVFHGPHAYVSPAWYSPDKPSVPTWNYATVHVSGAPKMIDDEKGMNGFLERLIHKYESARAKPWAYAPPKEFHAAMLTQIVGFELPIEKIEGKFKLSQNRSEKDQAAVIAGLATEGGKETAALMKARTGN